MYAISNGAGTLTARGATIEATMRNHARMLQEPWREHFPYRPDDMPGKAGDANARKVTQQYAEEVGDE